MSASMCYCTGYTVYTNNDYSSNHIVMLVDFFNIIIRLCLLAAMQVDDSRSCFLFQALINECGQLFGIHWRHPVEV